jgi:4-hydroxy-L-threonine phosphate dehydrogenase PdxA
MMVGDGLVGDRNIDALSPTVEALRAAGLDVVGRASADRPDHARERLRTEHLIVARKS